MTHDELLAKIEYVHLATDGVVNRNCSEEIDFLHTAVYKALRAVVERHFPYREDDWQKGYFECNECTWDSSIEYPCNTIKDISKVLE